MDNLNREALLVDNEVYNELKSTWYEAQDNPGALLRAERRIRNEWILKQLESLGLPHRFSETSVLDVTCGGGGVSTLLELKGFSVTDTQKSNYLEGDAYHLPFKTSSFDVVCSLDFFKSSVDSGRAIQEAARVLKPGGLFFFHSINRNFLSWLWVVKGVHLWGRACQKSLPQYDLLIKPKAMADLCHRQGFAMAKSVGIRPQVFSLPFLKSLMTRKPPSDLKFVLTQSQLISYLGMAIIKK